MSTNPLLLNIGCGLVPIKGFTNVDIAPPADVIHDLNAFPYPWESDSVDHIEANHVFEHLEDWWGAFRECARILKPRGRLVVRVPHDGSSSAIGYKDHRHIITMWSFHGIVGSRSGKNNEARLSNNSVPVVMASYELVPEPDFRWVARRFPRVFGWMATYLRNTVFEVKLEFIKIPDRGVQDGK